MGGVDGSWFVARVVAELPDNGGHRFGCATDEIDMGIGWSRILRRAGVDANRVGREETEGATCG